MGNFAIDDWLLEADQPADFGGPDASAPPSGPEAGGSPPGQQPSNAPPAGPTNPSPNEAPPEDISNDPKQPQMPEDDNHKDMDFETWKNTYIKESIKGNTGTLIDLIQKIRDRDLESVGRKFVEENLQIQFLRQMSNIMEASKTIRRMVNDQLDHNNPATTIVQFMQQALTTQPMLNSIFIKLLGYSGMKGDLHRAYIASLLGAVQVGSGGGNGKDFEDLILADNDYWVLICTRMASQFGNINMATWNLSSDDSERFLKPVETEKLNTGSPEEREALRHRVIIESISNRFKQRSFLITVVGTDGTIYNVGMDMGTMLIGAFVEGKLVVKTKISSNMEVMLDQKGEMIPLMDVEIRYRKSSGDVDGNGKPITKDEDFIKRTDSRLVLSASLEILKDAQSNLQGLSVQEIPYTGNPSDLQTISRCTYNAGELLMRQC